MSRTIPETLRQSVAKRARYCCKYCLCNEADSPFTFEVDHIISRKHGGPTVLENLAYTCILCN